MNTCDGVHAQPRHLACPATRPLARVGGDAGRIYFVRRHGPCLQVLEGIAGANQFRETLEKAPPGIFDARSWAYRNLKCGRQPTPPMPVRNGLEPFQPAASDR